MRELVSVVVPVYNVDKYVTHCIESLINQTYSNIEILLINDGSTDTSGIICDECAKRDNRIIVYHKENGGLSSARNYGIERANGRYIAFIDSDDWVEKEFVEVLVNSIETQNAEIACCGFLIVDENGNVKAVKKAKEQLCLNRDAAMEDLLLDKNVKNIAWNKLYLTDLFENVRYPHGKNYEDVATTYKLVRKANRVVIVPQALNYYLLRENSIIHTISEKNLNNWLEAHMNRRNEIAEGIDSKVLKLSDILFYYNIVKSCKRSKEATVVNRGKEYQKVLKNELREYGIWSLYKVLADFKLVLKIIVVACFL